jgi:hypothetical protein
LKLLLVIHQPSLHYSRPMLRVEKGFWCRRWMQEGKRDVRRKDVDGDIRSGRWGCIYNHA